MPTRRGWLLLIGAAFLGLGGRLLGMAELLALAAAGITLVAGALVYVSVIRAEVAGRRTLQPAHVAQGATVVVHLELLNRSHRRTPLLTAHDRGPKGRGSPLFTLAPLDGRQRARARYRLSLDERGLHQVGPLVLRRRDPFGVASRSATVLAPSDLVVFPRIDEVAPPPGLVADRTLDGMLHQGATGREREDFAMLRNYVEGDDLRLVHWASTAKYDHLVVRQDEDRRSRRATVLLDLRSDVHDRDTLEASVSAAASVAVSCCDHGAAVRVVTTDGLDTVATAGHGDVTGVLIELAGVAAGPGGSLADVLTAACSLVHDGVVVAITTDAAPISDLVALARFFEGSVSTILVRFVRERVVVDTQVGPRSSQPPGLGGAPVPALEALDVVVDVSPEVPFPVAWGAATPASVSVRP